MDKLKNLKMSSDLKNRIKEEYNKEKKKTTYTIRKAMENDVELDLRAVAAAVALTISVPVIDSVNKFKDLTRYELEISSNQSGGIESEENKNQS
ncbi:MAG: hypothetical protein ACRCWG_09470 [Sarcina sp.]